MEKKRVFIWVALMAIIAVVVFQIMKNGKEEDITIDKDFSRVEVESDNADILLLPIQKDEATVELDNNDNNRYKLDVEVKDETLEIVVERKGFRWFSFNFFSKKPAVLVGLPKKDYDTIKAETDNGTINVTQINAAELVSDTDNGEILLEEVESQKVIAKSDNGKIILKDIASQDIDVEIDNGDAVIEDSTGRITGESSNGMLTVITDNIEQPMDLETDNGQILVKTTNKSENIRFDVKTDNGSVNIYGQSIPEQAIGKGNIVIKLVSDNGSITVE
ncbi:DUF4097 family beta strand repeat-containing protein [Ureibacillus aquaedulcis]|uniref:DUF4097 family beta strand repeat-containing protein n=1 Tax=Ureibacillus aquaedulcis TaxID=3058421 RepID=A0ABT8GUJ4_9BACL|nr:DUF4097 family beta strand repeat-containing protein [Ureibacillus sp. BA0131]MDN4495090.1 DUF4097 family beta strand repeat-containing protein [Ureibacillus sp. BA0131]